MVVITNILKKIIFHFLVETALVVALITYTSDFPQVPWYTVGGGQEFLHLIITVPLLLIAAFLLNFYIKRDQFSNLIKWFPLLCILFISIYMVLDGGSLGAFKLRLGLGFNFCLLLLSIFLIIKDFMKN